MVQIKKLEELRPRDIILVVSEDAHDAHEASDPQHWQPTVEVVSFAKFDAGVRHDGPCWYAEFDAREVPIYEEQDGTFADGEFGPCEIWLLNRAGEQGVDVPNNSEVPGVK
jgi:hypothetical protein